MTNTRQAHAVFEQLVGHLDYSMLVVTTAVAGQRAGCLVGFATQTSIDPPRFLVCVSRRNHTFRVIESGAEALGVHLLSSGDLELARLFGAETGDDTDKFERCRWRSVAGDTPVLDDCPNWFVGMILDRQELGDHVGYLLEPRDAHEGDPAPALMFSAAQRIEPGHEA